MRPTQPVRSSRMKQRAVLRSLVGAALVCGCALIAAHAAAFSLKVTPIPIVITGGATSTMVEIQNEGSEPLRIQASVFDWTQAASGEDKLAPSTELLVFPSLVTIAAGASRKVRIGTQGGYGPNEKSFRVIFGEIPADITPVNGGQELVAMVANVSVPIFVRPPGATGGTRIEGLSATKDHVTFGVRSVGSAHALVERVRVDVLGEAGKPLGTAEIAGWYVLPGQVRPFDIPFGKDVSCAGAKKLVVTATSRESGAATATLDGPACAH
jgi:fimbrial chaperone protein